MSRFDDGILLSEFKKALLRNGAAAYSNLDDIFAHKFDFFITRYEDVMKVTGTHIPPHKWSYHRIGLITRGEADYTCGIHRFKARKNTLLIIPARMVTTSDWSAEGRGYTILFNSDFLIQNNLSYRSVDNKGILQLHVHPFLFLDDSQARSVKTIFQAILEEKELDNPYKNELIALKIIEMLILCERLYMDVHHVPNSAGTVELLKKFSELIEVHFNSRRDVSFYASELHVHPNHLNSVVKAHTGITAKESIQNRVLLEAKYLLHSTSLSVKEVAARIGFVNADYFASFFKRMEKTSPAAYRELFI
jgi:AraC family transcriptional regulator, transcriptional activator of pobA